MRLAARFPLVLFAILLLGHGCSLGPREDWAAAIRAGYEAAREDGPVGVRQSVAVKVIETTIRQRPEPLIAKSAGVADFAAHEAALIASAKARTRVVYDDLVVFSQRSAGSIGKGGQRWASFDYAKEPDAELDDNDRRMSVGAALISPVLAVELLEGILTGSVDERGPERRLGEQMVRYSARLAPDAAVREIRDEDRKDGVERLFATLGIQQDDFPVDVWLDRNDRIRAVRYLMRQQKDRVNAFQLSVFWEFLETPPRATPRAVTPPAAADTLQTTRFAEFVTELIRDFG